jgi:hypothetical protein
MNNISIIDIIEPYLTDKYKNIKEDILECYKDLYISDLKDFDIYEISNFFYELLHLFH